MFLPTPEVREVCLDCAGVSGLHVRPSREAPFPDPFALFFRGVLWSGFGVRFLTVSGVILDTFWQPGSPTGVTLGTKVTETGLQRKGRFFDGFCMILGFPPGLHFKRLGGVGG
jgi:hypothetical protein